MALISPCSYVYRLFRIFCTMCLASLIIVVIQEQTYQNRLIRTDLYQNRSINNQIKESPSTVEVSMFTSKSLGTRLIK